MAPLFAVSVLGLALLVQAPPQPSGAAGPNGATSVGAKKRSDRDLADILLPLAESQHRSGSMNPPSPPSGTNVRVSTASTASQWNPTIAVDPSDRLHLVGAGLDDRRVSDVKGAFYASFDGGTTWSQFFEKHFHPGPWAGGTSVAIGPAGETYLCTAIYVSTTSYLKAGRSIDGGVTEPQWVVLDKGIYQSVLEPRLAVDCSSGGYSGRVYLAYVLVPPHTEDPVAPVVGVAVSDDDAQSWKTVLVNDDIFDGADVPDVAVDSSGIVHAVFFNGTTRTMDADSSSDGGDDWGTDVPIAAAERYSIPNFNDTLTFGPKPVLAIDTSGGPFDGALYVAWTQDGGADGPDVVMSKSTDHGTTWSTPIFVSTVTTHSQFAPSMSVDPQGNVDVAFYDSRDDPNNVNLNLYVARSSDGGQSFQPDVKVTSTDFDPTAYTDGLQVIERTGIAASDRAVHAIWTDGRKGDNDIYTSAVDLDFHTDVDSISAATGGTATFTVSPGPLFGSDEYHVLGSLSGTTPGTDFFFENVPINYDLFMLATIYEANSNVFPGFTGALDATGSATAQLVSGPLPPALIGVQMDFAALVRVNGAVRWGSAATSVVIGN